MAGIWIDRVNRAAGEGPKRKITGTKGAHIRVQLPPDCADNGVATINRLHEPFWRRDVIFTWAGLRPLTYDPALPKGPLSNIRAIATVLKGEAGRIGFVDHVAEAYDEGVSDLPPDLLEPPNLSVRRLVFGDRNWPRTCAAKHLDALVAALVAASRRSAVVDVMADEEIAVPVPRLSSTRRSITAACTDTSKDDVTSSQITSAGPAAKARAMATRCFSPPES